MSTGGNIVGGDDNRAAARMLDINAIVHCRDACVRVDGHAAAAVDSFSADAFPACRCDGATSRNRDRASAVLIDVDGVLLGFNVAIQVEVYRASSRSASNGYALSVRNIQAKSAVVRQR